MIVRYETYKFVIVKAEMLIGAVHYDPLLPVFLTAHIISIKCAFRPGSKDEDRCRGSQRVKNPGQKGKGTIKCARRTDVCRP
jgi:hypothetical protein